MPAIYIHIPFCKQKCKYCDFTSYAGLDAFYEAYTAALKAEIEHVAGRNEWGDKLSLLSSKLQEQAGAPRHQSGELQNQAPALIDRSTGSIYIGGGTPTILEPQHIDSVLRAVKANFEVAGDAEISIEANPETVELKRLTQLREAGVNRLSIGFQSLDERLLKLLGRKHSPEQAVDAYRAARAAGFDNINIDLMSGLPGQTLAEWALTLEQVTALEPEHMSCYSLSVELGTPIEREIAEGKLDEPEEDLQADMLIYTMESLKESGYEHYEISNYAKPGKRCRHNLAYWKNLDYIGFGAGVHSKIGSSRFCNVSRPEEYIEKAVVDERIAEVAKLTPKDEMSETMFLGLRLTEGIDLAAFKERFGVPAEQVFGGQIDELLKEGLVELHGGALKLSSRGLLLGNEVFGRFV